MEEENTREIVGGINDQYVTTSNHLEQVDSYLERSDSA